MNVVDHPALCDFYTPALIDRGAVVAAVGATGAAPLLAAMLRNDIEAVIPQGAGRLADLFRATRDEVRAALPDMTERRAFLRQIMRGPAAEAALAGDTETALWTRLPLKPWRPHAIAKARRVRGSEWTSWLERATRPIFSASAPRAGRPARSMS